MQGLVTSLPVICLILFFKPNKTPTGKVSNLTVCFLYNPLVYSKLIVERSTLAIPNMWPLAGRGIINSSGPYKEVKARV